MLNSICNRTFRNARKRSAVISFSFAYELHILQFHQPFSSSSLSNVTNASSNQAVVVSYLTNSIGFSRERALSASKYLRFESPEKADSVLALLKKHHFSEAQITTLIRRRPPLLVSIPEKTLGPKIEFLQSIGVSTLDIPELICRSPNILARSLKKQIIPTYNLLKNSLHSSEDILFSIKRYPELLVVTLDAKVVPNMEIFREAGVPESGILYCLKHMPKILAKKPDDLKECIERVKRIGFHPEKNIFLQGVKVMGLALESTWEHKIEVYKKCGWSEEDVLESFRRQPHFINASESKINVVVDILVHKMGYHISDLVKNPVVILFSLEKKIVPRFSVYQVLLSKGLVKKKLALSRWLICSEQQFLERFVLCYEKEVPELLKLYRENLSKGVAQANHKSWR